MKKWKLIVLIVIAFVISAIFIWNSRALSEYRIIRKVVNHRVSFYDEMTYDNETLLDVVEFDGLDFFIFKADEYIDGEFNYQVYYVVSCKQVLGIRNYELYAFFYEDYYYIEWQRGRIGTYIYGVKENNNYHELKLMIDGEEDMIVDVTDTEILFFFSDEYLNITDVEVIVD